MIVIITVGLFFKACFLESKKLYVGMNFHYGVRHRALKIVEKFIIGNVRSVDTKKKNILDVNFTVWVLEELV